MISFILKVIKTQRIPIVIYVDFECISTPKQSNETIQRCKNLKLMLHIYMELRAMGFM